MRRARDLRQKDLANLTGWDQSTIYKLEAGKLRVKDYQYVALAKALECRIADLVDERGASVDGEIERAIETLRSLSADQRALWFQIGDSLTSKRDDTKAMGK